MILDHIWLTRVILLIQILLGIYTKPILDKYKIGNSN